MRHTPRYIKLKCVILLLCGGIHMFMKTFSSIDILLHNVSGVKPHHFCGLGSHM